jgi:hypothetical protein
MKLRLRKPRGSAEWAEKELALIRQEIDFLQERVDKLAIKVSKSK